MNILAFVDLHGSLTALKKISVAARKADILVCAGDLSIFEQNLDYLFYKLDQIGKPVLVIPGNHESDELLKMMCKQHKNTVYLEKDYYFTKNHLFLGCAGNGFARKDIHFARDTKKLEKILLKKRKELKNKLKYILVVHAEPYKTKLDKIYGQHSGNQTIRQFITRTRPDLVICGHFHDSAGKQDKIGKSLIINPGPYGKLLKV